MSQDRLDLLDYYTLLRVDEKAPADDIRRAFHTFAVKFHPDRHAGAVQAKRDRAAQIYRRGAEAYRVLMNPQARAAYDQRLKAGELRMRPEETGKMQRAPRSSPSKGMVMNARARPFAGKAQMALKKGDFATAKLNLRMALQHDPKNDVLKARLAEVEERLERKKKRRR